MKSSSARYATYFGQSNQDIWQNQSKIIIRHVADNLKSMFAYFPDILKSLAEKRKQLAVTLGHEKAELFGRFCTEEMRAYEIIRKHNFMREEIIDIVEKLLANYKKNDNGELATTFDNPFSDLHPKNAINAKREKAILASENLHGNYFGRRDTYKQLLADYNFGSNLGLSTLYKDNDGTIGITYRWANKYHLVGDYFSAQALYDDLLIWESTSTIDDFMASAANFSYFMAHCIFIQRGTAAVTEWIVRGVALHHGIELGDFLNDSIGWSWRALITPILDDYVHWYKTSCFVVKQRGQDQPLNMLQTT